MVKCKHCNEDIRIEKTIMTKNGRVQEVRWTHIHHGWETCNTWSRERAKPREKGLLFVHSMVPV